MSEPSISIGTIQGGQNNIGHTEIKGNQIQNVGATEAADIGKFFEALRSALPPAEDVTPEAMEARKAVDELETMAKAGDMPPDATAGGEESESAFARIVGPYIRAIGPYGPGAYRAVFAFGEEFFSSVAQKNSWVSASLKALKAFQAPQ